MKKTTWVWTSLDKKKFLSEFCNFLGNNALEKEDFIELKELENETHRFFVFKLKNIEA